MEPPNDETKHAPPNDLPSPLLQESLESQAFQKLSRPRPAPISSDESPYGNSLNEEPYSFRHKHLSINPDIKEKNVKRRSSRFGLGGLFGRSKPIEMDGRQEQLVTPREEDESTGKGVEVSYLPTFVSASKEIDVLPLMDSPGAQLRQKNSKPALRAKSSFKRETSGKSTASWDPPPLFQAYPQALKYATLRVPCLSAEAILRLHDSRSASVTAHTESYPADTNAPKPQKEKRLKRHTALEVLSKGDWTHKIFVLVTSGHFLQYAGDGNFDRLPEKIMPLTTESAAFASDAIPGQPYVLQVSQVADDQGTVDRDASKSMLKRLGLRHEMKRSTSTFLLVLQSPEEMSTWLAAVKKEIQAVGGKVYKSDESQTHSDDTLVPLLQQRPSQRYLVSRDPNRFSEKPEGLPSRISWFDNQHTGEVTAESNGTVASTGGKRQSLATQSSTVSRSLSNTTSSINQYHLDQLRESPRESYVSVDAKTASTSRGSSPPVSPDKVVSEVPDLSLAFAASRPTPSTYPRTETSYPRYSRPNPSNSPPQQSAHSTLKYGRTPSPAAPNFSVPTFSKRYSTANSSTKSSYSAIKSQTPTRSPEIPPQPILEPDSSLIKDSNSYVSELQHLRTPSPNIFKSSNGTHGNSHRYPPHSSGSYNPPSSSDGEKRFSRRLSSLEYSQGVSPIQSARQSPSPYPPPTVTLPAIPGANQAHPPALYPPPTTALPPIPSAGKLPQRYSMMPPMAPTRTAPSAVPITVSPTVSPAAPVGTSAPLENHPDLSGSDLRPNAAFTIAPAEVLNIGVNGQESTTLSFANEKSQYFAKLESSKVPENGGMRSSQVHRDVSPEQRPSTSPRIDFENAFEAEGLTPPLEESPPKPTREAPRPPFPRSDSAKTSRSPARIGREPPPVSSPATSPKPRISVSSRADSYFDGPAPHPFIPPIRVSERKFRGSLDGPWNVSYVAPQRTFFDLRVN